MTHTQGQADWNAIDSVHFFLDTQLTSSIDPPLEGPSKQSVSRSTALIASSISFSCSSPSTVPDPPMAILYEVYGQTLQVSTALFFLVPFLKGLGWQHCHNGILYIMLPQKFSLKIFGTFATPASLSWSAREEEEMLGCGVV